MDSERRIGDRRCWPCTVANAAVGLVVAWTPLAVLLAAGSGKAVPVATVWGFAVTVFAIYRLVDRGHLPLAEPVARVTGLHDRIGPGAPSTRSNSGESEAPPRADDCESESR